MDHAPGPNCHGTMHGRCTCEMNHKELLEAVEHLAATVKELRTESDQRRERERVWDEFSRNGLSFSIGATT